MSDMTASESREPVALTDALVPVREKLRAMGLDPDGEPEDTRGESAEDARARHQRRMETLAGRWRTLVPEMYQTASLDDLDDLQSPVRIRSWLRSGSLNLVLAGPVGTGKTHAAYAVGNQALEAGRWVEAYTVGDLMDSLRPGASDSYGTWERARRCHVLILDDLVAKATDWEAERMTLLLDARTREQRQTIVTTNVPSAELGEVWGNRFLDRLHHRLTAVTFTGASRRGGAW